MSKKPAQVSGAPSPEPEAEALRQLAELGLVVPTRDPSRPHTLAEMRCFKVGLAGFPGNGGRSFYGRFPCRGRGCATCAGRWAVREMAKFRSARPDFVGFQPLYRESPVHRPEADKIPDGSLWVTTVALPLGDPALLKKRVAALKERIATRAKRLVDRGVGVERVIVACDGSAVIVAMQGLADPKKRGRPPLPPVSGVWVPVAVADLFLSRTLSSTAVCGQVSWSKSWKPPKEEPTRKNLVIAGPPHITETAHRILWSEGYSYSPPGPAGPTWTSEDPIDVLHDAKRRAEEFWENPRCTACDGGISREDDHWWRDGLARCGVCDVAFDLFDFMTTGRTEREIEAHLRRRKLTFRRRRSLLEAALARTGTQLMPSGIWVPRQAQEGAA